MLIFFDRRLAFLATPKAGSTAIEVALESLATLAIARPAALKHGGITRFDAHLRPWLEAEAGAHFTTVALMREPVEWMRSWYRFRQRDDADDPEHAMAQVSFEDFALAACAEAPPAPARIGRQTDTLLGPGGARVDHVFRYEDMDRFTAFLEDRLDCALSLPRVNVPPKVDVTLSAGASARIDAALADERRFYDSL